MSVMSPEFSKVLSNQMVLLAELNYWKQRAKRRTLNSHTDAESYSFDMEELKRMRNEK